MRIVAHYEIQGKHLDRIDGFNAYQFSLTVAGIGLMRLCDSSTNPIVNTSVATQILCAK